MELLLLKQLALRELQIYVLDQDKLSLLIDYLTVEIGLLTPASLGSLGELHMEGSQERQPGISSFIAKQQLADYGATAYEGTVYV